MVMGSKNGLSHQSEWIALLDCFLFFVFCLMLKQNKNWVFFLLLVPLHQLPYFFSFLEHEEADR